MILQDNFFQIIDESFTKETGYYTIKLDKNHFIYESHFPGHPVTPGVIQLQIITELASKCLVKPLRIIKIEKCKFLKVIDPRQTKIIKVLIDLKTDREFINLTASIQNETLCFTKANIVFEIKH